LEDRRQLFFTLASRVGPTVTTERFQETRLRKDASTVVEYVALDFEVTDAQGLLR
jgi:hypothetical protein